VVDGQERVLRWLRFSLGVFSPPQPKEAQSVLVYIEKL